MILSKPLPNAAIGQEEWNLLLRKRRALKSKVKPPTATGQDNATLQSLPADPYLRAAHTLHMGKRPDALPYRDGEYVTILEAVLELR